MDINEIMCVDELEILVNISKFCSEDGMKVSFYQLNFYNQNINTNFKKKDIQKEDFSALINEYIIRIVYNED